MTHSEIIEAIKSCIEAHIAEAPYGINVHIIDIPYSDNFFEMRNVLTLKDKDICVSVYICGEDHKFIKIDDLHNALCEEGRLEVTNFYYECRNNEEKNRNYCRPEKTDYDKLVSESKNLEVKESLTRSDILDAAKECVCGHREQDYGSPEDNFQLIADLWDSYLFPKLKGAKDVITPLDVAMMMSLLKIARIRNGGGTGDSFVDLAGYAACGGEILGNHKF